MDIVLKLLIGFTLLIPFNCFSSTEPYVQLLCDEDKKNISINFYRLANDFEQKWNKLRAETNGPTPTVWKLRDMRTIKQTDEKGYWQAWIESTDVIERNCKIGKKELIISFGIISGNSNNLYGHCGGWFSSWIKVSHNNKLILNEQFEDGCSGDSIITNIELLDVEQPPKITKMKLKEYFRQ